MVLGTPALTIRAGWLERLRAAMARNLPSGRGLPDAAWRRRHAGVTLLLWLHVPAVGLFGLLSGVGPVHAAAEAFLLAAPAFAASWSLVPRTVRSVAASVGLLGASAVLVHISNGVVEMHFHFFVMIGVIALYQSWLPFLAAISFVVVHHAAAGIIDPNSVFNHPAARSAPVLWAAIHGGFVLAASAVNITTWRLVEHHSLHDPLTGLPNRSLFCDRVAQALLACARMNTRIAVLFIDLDGFKPVNDTLGHAAGDELLQVIADRLRFALRASDSIGRYGGDEFAVLLEDVHRPATIAPIVDRIQKALAVPVTIFDREITPGASVGIAVGGAGDSADALIRNADLAMYMAKSRRRGEFEFFEPSMRTELVDRVRLRQDLQVAVETDAITVAYQPVVDLESGAIVGAEALARWNHPERGPIPPTEFIALAEETDLIFAMGRRIISQVCATLGTWQRQGIVPGSFAMSVNLSARQVRDPGLVAFVAAALHDNGIRPGCLSLEITESVLLHDTDYAVAQLEALKALGTSLALDDFGTGYSSLNYLRRFPIDTLKIDRSFVMDLDRPGGNATLIRTILSLGESLNLRTIAEGVEGQAELDQLRSMGCRMAQGYHFARPLDPEAFVALTRSWTSPERTPEEALIYAS
jgi:diguanylate cyclase (GGDEF)-like protein